MSLVFFKNSFIYLLAFVLFAEIKTSVTIECGVPTVKPVIDGQRFERIINGKDAVPKSWPWIVSLRFVFNESTYHSCAGSLIDLDLVITAANCMIHFVSYNFVIVAGMLNNNFQNATLDSTNVFYPKEYLINSKYSYTNFTLGNDIALIRLNRNITLSDKVGIICLPKSNDTNTVVNKSVIVAGWYFN